MLMKVSDLDGRALNWAVAHSMWGVPFENDRGWAWKDRGDEVRILKNPNHEFRHWDFNPSGNWKHGGPLIEHFGIELQFNQCPKTALGYHDTMSDAGKFLSRERKKFTVSAHDSILVAVCRAIAFRSFRDEIEIPDELCEVTPCK